jgi:TFIIF-interacting CTD phosphatase-like protein
VKRGNNALREQSDLVNTRLQRRKARASPSENDTESESLNKLLPQANMKFPQRSEKGLNTVLERNESRGLKAPQDQATSTPRTRSLRSRKELMHSQCRRLRKASRELETSSSQDQATIGTSRRTREEE